MRISEAPTVPGGPYRRRRIKPKNLKPRSQSPGVQVMWCDLTENDCRAMCRILACQRQEAQSCKTPRRNKDLGRKLRASCCAHSTVKLIIGCSTDSSSSRLAQTGTWYANGEAVPAARPPKNHHPRLSEPLTHV